MTTKVASSARVAREHALEVHISGTVTVQQGVEGKLWRFSNSGLVPGDPAHSRRPAPAQRSPPGPLNRHKTIWASGVRAR